MRAWGLAVLALAGGTCLAGEESPEKILLYAYPIFAREPEFEASRPPSSREPKHCVYLPTEPPIPLLLPQRSDLGCVDRIRRSVRAMPYWVSRR